MFVVLICIISTSGTQINIHILYFYGSKKKPCLCIHDYENLYGEMDGVYSVDIELFLV